MPTRRTVLAALVIWPWAVRADPPPDGLAWHRTGLPRLFPLHFRTLPGHRYFAWLTAADTGADALAVHFGGGGVHRVLCPPGAYRVAVARGRVWQDEARLFGAETEIVHLPEALAFGTVGLATRRGWVVDLRNFAAAAVET